MQMNCNYAYTSAQIACNDSVQHLNYYHIKYILKIVQWEYNRITVNTWKIYISLTLTRLDTKIGDGLIQGRSVH